MGALCAEHSFGGAIRRGAARFAKNLVRGKQLATGANTRYNAYGVHEGLFLISASPLKGVGVAELEAAIEEEIEMIKTEGIDGAELERIKTKFIPGRSTAVIP